MRVTFQQFKGKWNPDYWTAIFWFDKLDNHFFLKRDKESCNWMPKHTEVEMLLEAILQVEGPEKREHLRERFIAAIERGYKSEAKFNQ